MQDNEFQSKIQLLLNWWHVLFTLRTVTVDEDADEDLTILITSDNMEESRGK